MELKALIVHLRRASSRSCQVDRLHHDLPVVTQVIDAVDGTTLTSVEMACYNRKVLSPVYPFRLRNTEVACFLSHRKCWQHIVDQDLDAAIVLEDDVGLDVSTFSSALELALSVIKPGDFIRFPIKNREADGEIISSKSYVAIRKPQKIALGMVAQIITKDAAAKLLAASETFDRPVDCFLQMNWLHRVNVLSVWPSGVSEISQTLGGSTIDHKAKSIGSKIKREFLRPIYRYKIKKLAQASVD
jgi:GR25 family glycosyltransferase involved in LPS biosynthesis